MTNVFTTESAISFTTAIDRGAAMVDVGLAVSRQAGCEGVGETRRLRAGQALAGMGTWWPNTPPVEVLASDEGVQIVWISSSRANLQIGRAHV